MKIKNNIAFGAKFENKTYIKTYDKTNKCFKKTPVAFVKLDSKNRGDMHAIDTVFYTWENAKFTKKIRTAAHFINGYDINVFALTSQLEDFDNLDYRKILGLAEMRLDNLNKNSIFLQYLQVKPEAINVNQPGLKTHKHVGKSILSSLKKIYRNISLISDNNRNVEKFYRKNGFVRDFRYHGYYIWNSNISKKIVKRIANIFSRIGL